MPARPDPERLAVWRQFLEAHATITAQLARELEAERELPLPWYDVLVQLQEHGGRLRMQELARACLINKSSLTRLVERMEASGLVLREPCEEDRRGTVAALTAEGRATLRHAAPVHLRGVQRSFAAKLTDSDVTALARAFAKLLPRDA
jgi:DNA-binding MarR family transcriptional regulator